MRWNDYGEHELAFLSAEELSASDYPIIRISQSTPTGDAILFYKAGIIHPASNQWHILLPAPGYHNQSNEGASRNPRNKIVIQIWATHERILDWALPNCPIKPIPNSTTRHANYRKPNWFCERPMPKSMRDYLTTTTLADVADEFWRLCHHPTYSGDSQLGEWERDQALLDILGGGIYSVDLLSIARSAMSQEDYRDLSSNILFADSDQMSEEAQHARACLEIWKYVLNGYGMCPQFSASDLLGEKKGRMIRKYRNFAEMSEIQSMMRMYEDGIPIDDIVA